MLDFVVPLLLYCSFWVCQVLEGHLFGSPGMRQNCIGWGLETVHELVQFHHRRVDELHFDEYDLVMSNSPSQSRVYIA